MSAAFDYSPYVTPEISQRRKQGALRSNQSTALPSGGKCNVDNKYQQNKTVCSPQALRYQRKGGTGAAQRDTRPLAEVLMMTPEPSPASPMRPLTQAHTDPFAEDRKRDLGRRPKLLTPEPKQDPPKGKRCDPEAMMESPPATNIYGVRIHKKMVDGGVNDATRGNLFGGMNVANNNAPAATWIGKEKAAEKLPDSMRFRNSMRYKSSLGRTDDPLTPAHSEARVIAKKHASRKHQETPDVPLPKPKPYKFTTPFARTGSVAASVKLHGRRHFEKPNPRTFAHEDGMLKREEREKLMAQTNSPQRRYLNSQRYGQGSGSAPYARDTSFPAQLAPRYAKKPVLKAYKSSVFPE